MVSINLVGVFSVMFYILLIVLVIVLIVLAIEAIKTVNKANLLLDDIKQKSDKLNGVFDAVEATSSVVNGLTEHLTTSITNVITKLFNRKGDGRNE